jgi:hypothetical protein
MGVVAASPMGYMYIIGIVGRSQEFFPVDPFLTAQAVVLKDPEMIPSAIIPIPDAEWLRKVRWVILGDIEIVLFSLKNPLF